MIAATATTLSSIAPEEVTSICIRRTGSKRATSYSNWLDIAAVRKKHGDIAVRWDEVYGCYVSTGSTGTDSKLATLMVFVNREQAND